MKNIDECVKSSFWFKKLLSMSESERKKTADDILEKAPLKIRNSFKNPRKYEIVGLTGCQIYIPLKGKNFVYHELPELAIVLYDKHHQVVIVAANESSKGVVSVVDFNQKFKGTDVYHSLKWSNMIRAIPYVTRCTLKAQIMSDLATQGSIDDRPTPEGRALTELLKKQNSHFVGFAPNSLYVKIKGASEELACLWSHPWALPTLCYFSRGSGNFLIAGPGIRYNQVALDEVPMNGITWGSSVKGFTG